MAPGGRESYVLLKDRSLTGEIRSGMRRTKFMGHLMMLYQESALFDFHSAGCHGPGK